MSARGFFIAGTDTGVGKTWVTVRLLGELRSRGLRAAGMKPVECGGHDDARAILAATADVALELTRVNPYHLPEPLAPIAQTGPAIDFEVIKTAFAELAADRDGVLVEGAGGWLVPIDASRTMEDLALALNLPVILIAANRLGVLNHVLLSLLAINSSGLPCRAVFLNERPASHDASSAGNARVLRELLPDVPVFAGDIMGLASLLFPA